jgi:hypothetical protein
MYGSGLRSYRGGWCGVRVALAARCRGEEMVGKFERYSTIEPVNKELEDCVMTVIIRSTDCGNSPKNRFVEDLEVTFARRDTGFLLNRVADDIHWNIFGETSIRGKDALEQAIESIPQDREVTEITINHVVTHGKVGAVNGIIKRKNDRTYEFCSVYEFSNTKGTNVRDITSYIISRA